MRGMTLVDVIVGVALIALVFSGLFAAFELAVGVTTAARAAAGGNALVNSQIEYARSLPYASVGTINGSPSGVLYSTTTAQANGISYVVATRVWYIDDPADGIGPSDTDGNPNDYKEIMVTATWPQRDGTGTVSAASYVVPAH